MESAAEVKRRQESDIPQLTRIQKVIPSREWKKKFGYPTDRLKSPDYYVHYGRIEFGNRALVEATATNLRKCILQLEDAIPWFKDNELPVHFAVVVLDSLNSPSQRIYKLKPYKNWTVLREVHKKVGGHGESQTQHVCGLPLFVIYRKDFKRLK